MIHIDIHWQSLTPFASCCFGAFISCFGHPSALLRRRPVAKSWASRCFLRLCIPTQSEFLSGIVLNVCFRYEKEKVGKHKGCEGRCKSGKILESCEIKELNTSDCAWPRASSHHRLPQPLIRCPEISEMFIWKASVQFCSTCIPHSRAMPLPPKALPKAQQGGWAQPQNMELPKAELPQNGTCLHMVQRISTIANLPLNLLDLHRLTIFWSKFSTFNVAATPPMVHQIAAGSLGTYCQDPHPTQHCIQGSKRLARALGGRIVFIMLSIIIIITIMTITITITTTIIITTTITFIVEPLVSTRANVWITCCWSQTVAGSPQLREREARVPDQVLFRFGATSLQAGF